MVVASAVVVLAAGAGLGGAAAGGSPPSRDHGRGHWFDRACTTPWAAVAECDAQVVTDASGTPLASSSPPAGAYGPVQFHTAYSLPTASAAAAPPTIAIVDAYDDQNAEADLGTFSSFYGLPACTTANGCFRKVNQSGGTSYPAPNSGWALEISLDIETAHEICENCSILLVEASSSSLANLGAAENEAAKLGANAISNSWGGGESSAETSYDNSYFNHPGIAITASSGDGGYGVEYPAASRFVTAAGGTTLTLYADSTYKSESAWVDGGSGCSSYEPKPSWQTDTGCAHRTVVDVAADADPNTGAAVYDSVPYSGQSGWFQVGGTSLSSPLLAAVYALAGATGAIVDGSTPYAYAGTSSLHDVATGSNGSCATAYLCTAIAGYDGPTGVGSPNGTGAFSPTPPAADFSLNVSPSSRTVTQGSAASAVYTVSVTDVGGFAGAVALGASGLPSGASAGFDTNPATSSSTLTVTTTASLAVGSYPFTVTGLSGSLTHTAAATLVVQAAPAPNFTISVTPSSQSLAASGTTAYTVTITPQNGFTGQVSLSVAGLPSRVTGSFSPNPTTSTSTLTLTSTNARRRTVTLTITGRSGSLSHSAGVTLSVA